MVQIVLVLLFMKINCLILLFLVLNPFFILQIVRDILLNIIYEKYNNNTKNLINLYKYESYRNTQTTSY